MRKQNWLQKSILAMLALGVAGMGGTAQAENVVMPMMKNQSQTTYNSAILGDVKRDIAYVNTGVLQNGIYHFTQKETVININGVTDQKEGKRDLVEFGPWFSQLSAAISGSVPTYDEDGNKIKYDPKTIVSNQVVMDLHGNQLKVEAVYNQGKGQTGIAAIAAQNRVERAGKVEINDAGAMSVNVKGDKMTAGLFADGGGKIIIYNGGPDAANKVLTIRGKSKNKNSGVGIKTMNGNIQANSGDGKQSEITIEGLVDVVADGKMDEDGYASNEAISAVASDINIGGGVIKAINGAWAAIRAYGEFTTPNYGIVNINTENRIYENEIGNALGGDVSVHKVNDFDIGNNTVKIEGDLVTNGGMGTKGQINVGLNGSASYWNGNYADTVGYGYTQGSFGAVNLKMVNGSHWKGFGNGSMYIAMKGEGTSWTGFSIVNKVQLELDDGATWHNAITPDQRDQKGNQTVDAQIRFLKSNKGIIDMTGGNVFVATGESLDGHTTADNPSGIIEQTHGITGNVVIEEYEGDSTVLYRHDSNTPTNIIGGTITIQKAKTGSKITLRTDNAGLLTDSMKAKDKNLVSETLNCLARKLFYKDYLNSKNDLNGYVEIAEGLTSASARKTIGDITYESRTGQGSYKYTKAVEKPKEQDDTQEQTISEFTTPITGDMEKDKVYVDANVLRNHVYTFTKKKSDITVRNGSVAIDKPERNKGIAALVGIGNDIEINARGNDISFNGINTIVDNCAYGMYVTNNTQVTGKNINASAVSEAEGARGVYVGDGGKLVIQGNVAVSAKHVNEGPAHGIYLFAKNNFLGIEGDLTMKGTGEDLYGVKSDNNDATGIYVYDSGESRVFVDGKSEIYVKGVGVDLRGGWGNDAGRKNMVSLMYGDIITPDDVTQSGYQAVTARSGTFRIGMNRDNTGSIRKEVNIFGMVAIGKKGKVYMGLGTKDSKFTGVVDKDDRGMATLCIENGAMWQHRKTSADKTLYSKLSHLNNFMGGDTIQNRGTIYQEDINDIAIDNYSGHTLVIYKHKETKENEMNQGLDVLGGNIIIGNAQKGSEITLRTDSIGLKTDSDEAKDKKLINDTLDNLAGKLFYAAYTKGERNLKGYVEIAEGLTSSSASKRIEKMSFKENGQGTYRYDEKRQFAYGTRTLVNYMVMNRGSERLVRDTQEEYEDPIIKDIELTGDASVEIISELKGEEEIEGCAALYNKRGKDGDIVDTDIIVNMANHSLALYAKDEGMSGKVFAVRTLGGTPAKNSSIKFINMKEGVPLVLKATTSEETAYGMYVDDNGEISVLGDVKMEKVESKNSGNAIGFCIAGKDSTIDIKGSVNINTIKAGGDTRQGISNTGENGKLFIDGLLDMDISSDHSSHTGIYSFGKNSVTAIGGGHILMGAQQSLKDTSLVKVHGGLVSINMNENQTEAGDKETVLQGAIFTENEGKVYVGLSTKSSSWTGISDYSEKMGAVYLSLFNGATWNNQVTHKESQYFKGSRLTKLTGGATSEKRGVIFQQDEKDIIIDDYRGHTLVIYDHKDAKENLSDKGLSMKGGNIIIGKAEDGSEITLRTSNNGLAIDSDKEEDKNLVNDTLENLAGKLFYTAYKNGEKKLTGKVEIAEGLTSSAVSKKIGFMTFKAGTGQGQYVPSGDTPKPPIPSKPSAQEFFELWKTLPGNENKTLQDFFNFLKGEKGENGKSAYEIWKSRPGNENKTEDDFFHFLKGKSAFDLWREIQGNENKTMDDFWEFLGRKKNPGDVVIGPKETLIMRTAKSAMATTMMVMRDNMVTMAERVGELRNHAESGIWARTYGGKSIYDKDNTKFSINYHGVQIGVDRKLDNGWHAGIALDYHTGNANYENGGTGKPNLYTVGFYGSKIDADGSYIDLMAKVGRGGNEYTVYNAVGNHVKADYKANAYSLSVEYGKRMEWDGLYIEPQIQISYMNIQSVDYDGTSDYADGSILHVKQAGMTSCVGRVGLAVGKKTENTTRYLRLGFLHEFAGDSSSTFGADVVGQETKTIDQDFRDTWVEAVLGITHRLDNNKMIYADVAKGFGGDYRKDWKANVGMRMKF